MRIDCERCGYGNTFDQPYAYHAGFSNVGFLYNDAGHKTLVWSSFDPAYVSIVGEVHPWALTLEKRVIFESALMSIAEGDNWRFTNPPRCLKCHAPIGKPMFEDISYVLYSDSLDVSELSQGGGLGSLLKHRDA